MTYPVDDTGFTAPTGREIKADYEEVFETESGLVPDWERDTFLGAHSAALAAVLGDLAESVQLLADSRSINNASGVILDDLVSLVLPEGRQEATPSTVETTLFGEQDTEIPAGSLIEDEDGVRWRLDEDAKLATPEGGVSSLYIETGVLAIAQEDGPIPAPVNTTWKIVTPVDGWDRVENPNVEATLGQARETDTELLRRRNRSLQIGTTGTVPGIRAAVESLDFVQQALVFDNPNPTTQTIEGISMDPHSYAVVVYPDVATTDDEEALGRRLLSVAPAGIKAVGSETVDIEAEDGYDKTLRWNHATTQGVDVDVTIVLEPDATSTSTDVEAQIADAVSEFFQTRAVGQTVKYHEVYDAVVDVEAAPQFESLTLTIESGTSNVTIPSSLVPIPNETVTVS